MTQTVKKDIVMSAKEIIARRTAKELKDGMVVNLGIGLPTMVPQYLPEDVHVTIQSENGIVGMGAASGNGEAHVTDAFWEVCRWIRKAPLPTG